MFLIIKGEAELVMLQSSNHYCAHKINDICDSDSPEYWSCLETTSFKEKIFFNKNDWVYG